LAWTLLTPSPPPPPQHFSTQQQRQQQLFNGRFISRQKPTWLVLSNLWPSHLDGTNVINKGKYSDLMDFDFSSLPMDMDSFHVH
jgi:hypothetical protein